MDKEATKQIEELKELVMIQYILAKNLTTDVGFSDEVKEKLYDKVFFYMDCIAAHITENRMTISKSMNDELVDWLGAHDEDGIAVIFENYHAMVDSDEFKGLMKP